MDYTSAADYGYWFIADDGEVITLALLCKSDALVRL